VVARDLLHESEAAIKSAAHGVWSLPRPQVVDTHELDERRRHGAVLGLATPTEQVLADVERNALTEIDV
jgi:hypothetical protein